MPSLIVITKNSTAGNTNWCNNNTIGLISCAVSAPYASTLLSNQVFTVATINFTVVSSAVGVADFTLPQYRSVCAGVSVTDHPFYRMDGDVCAV